MGGRPRVPRRVRLQRPHRSLLFERYWEESDVRVRWRRLEVLMQRALRAMHETADRRYRAAFGAGPVPSRRDGLVLECGCYLPRGEDCEARGFPVGCYYSHASEGVLDGIDR
jgi:hypothetical protein